MAVTALTLTVISKPTLSSDERFEMKKLVIQSLPVTPYRLPPLPNDFQVVVLNDHRRQQLTVLTIP